MGNSISVEDKDAVISKLRCLLDALNRHLREDIITAVKSVNDMAQMRTGFHSLSTEDQDLVSYMNAANCFLESLDFEYSWLATACDPLNVENGPDRERVAIAQIIHKRVYIICLKCSKLLEVVDQVIDIHSTNVKNKILQIYTHEGVLFAVREAISRVSPNISQGYIDSMIALHDKVQVGNLPEGDMGSAISTLRRFVENTFQSRFDDVQHLLHGEDCDCMNYNIIYKSKETSTGLISDIKDVFENIDENIQSLDENTDIFVIGHNRHIQLFLKNKVIGDFEDKLKKYLLL